jgi:hypothetical protein
MRPLLAAQNKRLHGSAIDTTSWILQLVRPRQNITTPKATLENLRIRVPTVLKTKGPLSVRSSPVEEAIFSPASLSAQRHFSRLMDAKPAVDWPSGRLMRASSQHI